MKKRFSLFVMVTLFAVQAFPQNSFDTALNEAVADIRQKVPLNATVAAPEFVIRREVMAEQSAVQLSDYLITELSSKLINTGSFKVLERQKINMDAVQTSLLFDASGSVSDESAQGIGHFLGAQYLVIGSLRMFGQELRLYVETVKVEQALKIASYSKSINRNELNTFYAVQSWNPPQPATSPQPGTSSGRTYTTSDTGVYVGIVSFGDQAEDLTSGTPIFLDATGLTRINNILDNSYRRTTRSGTLLFYGVHRALAALSANAGKYPQNLDGVYLLTFTDGLDTGSNSFALSPVENQDFSDKSDTDYQAYLSGQIANRPVAGRAITAYSAGVRGSDVQDTTLFRRSLSSLASGADNFYELSNFSQLNDRFDAIAKDLTITTTNTTFELRTPSFSLGTKIRMTFDNVSSAASSGRYIEGTITAGPSPRTYMLTNIVYGGTSSATGTQITGVMNGTEVIYTFNNFKGYDPAVDKQVKQWTQRMGSSIWQVNSEYEASNSTTTTIEHRSAVVYIALDSSRSLSDSDVVAVRTAMKQFVRTLYERSQNQSAAVQTGTLTITAVADGTFTVTGNGVNQSANLSAGEKWSKADLAAGTYTLTIRYSDGKSESKTVSVTSGQVAVAGFMYQPPQPSTLVVTAVTAGTLTVTGNGVNQSVNLSAGGNWSKTALVAGTYTLTIRYADGKSETKTVPVTSGRHSVWELSVEGKQCV
jgi:predicted carbohydrate-binding protein with CBM5 and CBM33 domain/TolB-like protein